MNSLSEKEISLKYENLELKIPGVWPDWEKAGVELAQDLWCTWQVTDGELIRVIALVAMRVKGLNLSKHINPAFAYAGLYPERIRNLDYVAAELKMEDP